MRLSVSPLTETWLEIPILGIAVLTIFTQVVAYECCRSQTIWWRLGPQTDPSICLQRMVGRLQSADAYWAFRAAQHGQEWVDIRRLSPAELALQRADSIRALNETCCAPGSY